ncbi:Rcat domain-containing protein, partial [Aspergillus aculeatinus CBS 121060]
IECCVCLDQFQRSEVTRVGCDHEYCHDCIKQLFTKSLQDDSLFPPKCCGQEIRLALVEDLLNEDEIETFHHREIEHTTAHRVYCGNRACGAFIRPELITGDRARCTGCLNLTCARCMNPFHFDADCPEDPAIQATLALAEQEGWRRCYSCKAVVQLSRGCNHMRCRCGAQFCYRCGAKWRTCHCPQYERGNHFANPEWVMPPPRDH